MKYSLVLAALLCAVSLVAEVEEIEEIITPPSSQVSSSPCECSNAIVEPVSCVCPDVLQTSQNIIVSVVGQGVAPMNTDSPAQAYALAKRAAIADGYRLIAEKVKGVRVDGQDLIKNMMVKRSTVRTAVAAMVRNANIVETSFKDGLCEVEMEIIIHHSQFAH